MAKNQPRFSTGLI